MNRPGTFAFAAIFILAALSSPPPTRADTPAGNACVAQLKLASGNKLTIIGTPSAPEGQDETRSWQILQSQGFAPVGNFDMSRCSPEYLVSASTNGIEHVYSYALGSKNGLPKEILNGSKLKKDLLLAQHVRATVAVVNQFAKNASIHVGASIYGMVAGQSERNRMLQAEGLSDLVAGTLNDQEDYQRGIRRTPADPAMTQAFSSDDLCELGALVSARYGRGGIGAGLLSTPKNRCGLYTYSRQRQRDWTDGQVGAITELENRTGVLSMRVSPNFSMLLFDCRNAPDSDIFDGRRLESRKTPKERNSLLPRMCDGKEPLVPMALYSMREPNTFLQLIDFQSPDKLRTKRFAYSTQKFLQDVTGTLVPATSLPIAAADMIVEDAMKRHGSKLANDPSRGYAALQEEARDGRLEIDPTGVMREVFAKSIETIKDLDHAEKAKLLGKLRSDRPQDVAQGMSESLGAISAHQEGTRFTPQGGDRQRARQEKARQDSLNRFTSWVAQPGRISSLDAQLSSAAEAENGRGAERKPAAPKTPEALGAAQSAGKCDPNAKSVIEIMVDGLRPDRLQDAAERGLIPTISSRILGHSAQFDAFSTNTVSTSAWATEQTAQPEDQHTVTGSSDASRDPKQSISNHLNNLKAFLFHRNRGNSPFEAAIEAGSSIDPPCLAPDQISASTSPVMEKVNVPVKGLIHSLGKSSVVNFAWGNLNAANLYDLGTAKDRAKDIHDHPCQRRLVKAWFGSIDDDEHTGNHVLDHSYGVLDQAVKTVLDSAAKDPVLKNAKIVLVSDHGHSGGYEPIGSPYNPLKDRAVDIRDTRFNIVKFLAGDYPGASKDLNFVVGANVPDDSKPGGMISLPLRATQLRDSWTYKGRKMNPGKEGFKDHRSIFVSSDGNDMARAVLTDNGGKAPQTRKTYYDLTHYVNDAGKPVDLVDALLEYQLPPNHVMQNDREMMNAIREKTGFRPTEHFTMALQGTPEQEKLARESADALADQALGIPAGSHGRSTRPPIVVRGHGGQAGLILTQDVPNPDGPGTHPLYRYVVLERGSFSQDADGRIHGKTDRSKTVGADPFGYHFGQNQGEVPQDWLTKDQWLQKTRGEEFPSVIFGLSRNLTLAPSHDEGTPHAAKFAAQQQDFILFSNLYYDYNTFQNQESDHGDMHRRTAQITFVATGCDQPTKMPDAVTGESIAATVSQMLACPNIGGEGKLAAIQSACRSGADLTRAPAIDVRSGTAK